MTVWGVFDIDGRLVVLCATKDLAEREAERDQAEHYYPCTVEELNVKQDGSAGAEHSEG